MTMAGSAPDPTARRLFSWGWTGEWRPRDRAKAPGWESNTIPLRRRLTLVGPYCRELQVIRRYLPGDTSFSQPARLSSPK